MNPQTHRSLQGIREARGKEYGKLLQKLLAIAFLETGVSTLTEHGIQGIDLDLEIGNERYGIEVKSCEGDTISLGKKDLAGLHRLHRERARVFVAVLGSGLLDEWIFVRFHPDEFPPNRKLTTFQLRAYRDRDLERRVHGPFGDAVEKHANTAILHGQKGLDEVLATYPARRQA